MLEKTVLRARQEHLDLPVHPDLPVYPETREIPESRVPPVLPDFPEPLVYQVPKVLWVPLDPNRLCRISL